jgi:hypothetical protein
MLMKLVVAKDEAVATVKGLLDARAASSSCFGTSGNLLALPPAALSYKLHEATSAM